jgi:hypothetical protein
MARDRHSSGGQRHTGRVTPSKIRRGAVLAVDGMLVVGAGALGGLFGSGVASAVAPTPGWNGSSTPVPSGPDTPAANPNATWDSVSCVSAAFCAGAGSYSGTSSDLPLLGVDANGTWTTREAPLPSDADPGSPARLSAISCPAVGTCEAIGFYVGGGHEFGLIETLSGGAWSAMAAPVPADATGTGSFLKSVDCQTAQTCVAVGEYQGNGGTFGLIDTESGGSWTAQQAPQPADAAANQNVLPESVSCPSMGACASTGTYFNGDGNLQGILFQQASNGQWSGEAAPLPAGTATGNNEFSLLGAVSCAAVCEAVGQVEDAASTDQGLLEQLTGGGWTASLAPKPANAGSGTNANAGLNGVSCTFDGTCNAVGSYNDVTDGSGRPLIDVINGTSVTPIEGPQPADTASGADMAGSLNAVSCVSGDQCAAVGTYRNNTVSGLNVALTDSSSGGSWSAPTVPMPANAGSGAQASSILNSVSCAARSSCEAVGNYADAAANGFGLVQSYVPPEGYWSVASDGGIFNYGTTASFHGSMGGQHLNAPMVGMAATPGGGGYWEVGSDGGIFSFGNATFHGSTGSLRLNAPIVGMAATPDGSGYWLVASDGGIFNYGDAGFFGSAGSVHLNKPIVGMAATPDGHGYWLVASDGGIFNYGDAGFLGSRGGQPLNNPVVGMASTASGLGYWLVASDGGIFTYGDAGFLGSRGGQPLNKPIVGMMSTFDGAGYWLTASDGGIFSYGDTGFFGSAGSIHLNAPVVNGTAS